MQHLVATSYSNQLLVLSSPVVIGWKGLCNGHKTPIPSFQPRANVKAMSMHVNNHGLNLALPLVNFEKTSVQWGHQRLCTNKSAHRIGHGLGNGRRGSKPSFVTAFYYGSGQQRRLGQFCLARLSCSSSQFKSCREPRHGCTYKNSSIKLADLWAHWQQHRNYVFHCQGAGSDSIGDYSFNLWEEGADDNSAKSDGNLSGEDGDGGDDIHLHTDDNDVEVSDDNLWNLPIGPRLPLSCCSLFGHLPSWIDEWIESSKKNDSSQENSASALACGQSFPDLLSSENPLKQLLTQDPFDNFFDNCTPFKASNSLSPGCSLPSIPHPRRGPKLCVMDALRNLLYPRVMKRMSKMYGTGFMFLIGIGYFLQGFRCFPWFGVSYMLKDGLQVDPGQMQFLLSTAALPMVAKPIYGLISDSVYIRKAHRVPYLAISGLLQLMSWGALAFWPEATSSQFYVTVALTFGNLGAAIADVMNDALVAEMSKKTGCCVQQGELQSFAWMIMASGGLLGSLLEGIAIKRLPFASMFKVFVAMLGVHFFACLMANEKLFNLSPPPSAHLQSPSPPFTDNKLPRGKTKTGTSKRKKSHISIDSNAETSGGARVTHRSKAGRTFSQLNEQLRVLGSLLKKKEISRLLLWVCASYAVVPAMGSGIFYFQTEVLNIPPIFIGLSRMVGQMGLMLAGQLYGGVLKGFPLRSLLGSVQVLLALSMLSDFVLVKRLNLQMDIPDEYYVLGASPLVDCISQFKILPIIVRLSQLCPPGSEGSLMALFSSCLCLAGLCSSYFGVAVARHLGISAQSFEGLPTGILIQAFFTFLPALFICFMPGQEANSMSPAKKEEEKDS